MRIRRWGAAVVGSGLLFGTTAAAAEAGPRTVSCDRYVSGVVGDVVVKDGRSCWINRAQVQGSVTLEGDAQVVVDHSEVRGSITSRGEHPVFIAVRESRTGYIGAGSFEVSHNPWGSVFLEKANVGALDVSGFPMSAEAREVTFRGPVNLNYSPGRFDDVEVHGDLATVNAYNHGFAMRLGKIHGSANLDTSEVCGSRFDGSVTVGGYGGTFGTNGRTCGGNTVAGDFHYGATFDSRYGRAPRVSGNTIRGYASSDVKSMFPLAGSHNRFLGGADEGLRNMQRTRVADMTPFDFSSGRARAQTVRDAAH